MKNVLVLLTFNIVLNASACINEYGTKLNGEVTYDEPVYGKISPNLKKPNEVRQIAKELLTAYERSDSIEYLSDYAAALTYLGEYEKAKNIYIDIETTHPGLYTTASNLGTLYELTGQPDSALFWIKKSVTLNPESHSGSEWIHIKILEFKLSGKRDYNNSILGLDFGDDPLPVYPDSLNLRQLKQHIHHQLLERLTFIKAPNKIIGNLYFDFGNVLAKTNNVQSALEAYEEAKRFGFKSPNMDQRIETFEILALKAKPHQTRHEVFEFIKDYILVFLILFGIIILVSLSLIIKLIKKIRR